MLSTLNQIKLQFQVKERKVNENYQATILQQRILNSWNMLPTVVVNAPSLNAFKNRLDSHWRQYKYSQHSVRDACNLNKSNLERPRPDTGYVVQLKSEVDEVVSIRVRLNHTYY